MNLNINSNFFNSMLGGSSSGNSNMGLTGLLSDYNSIRNGSYLKLAKHYYSTDTAKKTTQKRFSNQVDVGTEDKTTKAASESAWKDVAALRKSKLYETEDTGALLKNVKAFVSDYNDVLESAQNSSNSNIWKDAAKLASKTENYAGELSKVGITVKSDNTLALDEDTFRSADIEDVKKLFAGDFSFGSNTQDQLLKLVNDASGNVTSGLYNTSGSMNGMTVGSFYDSFF